MTHSGWGSAGPQETAVWPPQPAPEPPRDPDGSRAPWEVDLRTDPVQGRYRSRRELRDEREERGPAPAATTSGPTTSGPSTQELAVYRAQPPAPPAPGYPAQLAPWEDGPRREDPDGRGGRVKTSVENWSRWASGLGLPPRDGSGFGRYSKAERLLPPAVWIAVGLGAAGLIGLLTGVLVTAPTSGSPSAAAEATSTATVTVTQQVTQAPVTETTTRTRTKTVTETTTAAAPTNAGGGGGALAPGAQGPQVARLQAALAALGLYQGQPTGTYDEPTRAAVQAFQAQAGVTGDPPGVAGPATLAALAQAVGR